MDLFAFPVELYLEARHQRATASGLWGFIAKDRTAVNFFEALWLRQYWAHRCAQTEGLPC